MVVLKLFEGVCGDVGLDIALNGDKLVTADIGSTYPDIHLLTDRIESLHGAALLFGLCLSKALFGIECEELNELKPLVVTILGVACGGGVLNHVVTLRHRKVISPVKDDLTVFFRHLVDFVSKRLKNVFFESVLLDYTRNKHSCFFSTDTVLNTDTVLDILKVYLSTRCSLSKAVHRLIGIVISILDKDLREEFFSDIFGCTLLEVGLNTDIIGVGEKDLTGCKVYGCNFTGVIVSPKLKTVLFIHHFHCRELFLLGLEGEGQVLFDSLFPVDLTGDGLVVVIKHKYIRNCRSS